MTLQAIFGTLTFIFCLEILKDQYLVKKGIEEMFLAKYGLYENPKRYIEKFCKSKKEDREKKGFTCDLDFFWLREGNFVNICKTNFKPTSFPRRYYRLVLQCKLGGVPIKSLRSEWRLFR